VDATTSLGDSIGEFGHFLVASWLHVLTQQFVAADDRVDR
jgi:hypothetical protein